MCRYNYKTLDCKDLEDCLLLWIFTFSDFLWKLANNKMNPIEVNSLFKRACFPAFCHCHWKWPFTSRTRNCPCIRDSGKWYFLLSRRPSIERNLGLSLPGLHPTDKFPLQNPDRSWHSFSLPLSFPGGTFWPFWNVHSLTLVPAELLKPKGWGNSFSKWKLSVR